MKIYIDSGNKEEIQKAVETGLIDGVTTNPSLLAKEGVSLEEAFQDILDILKPLGRKATLSAEVTHITSANDMIEQGKELASLDEKIVVKLPLTKDGLIATQELSLQGIRCNVTLCFSPMQAVLAAKAGAWCVSPFLGRIDDEGHDSLEILQEIRDLFDKYEFETQILAASIRSTSHVRESGLIGSDIVTMPYDVFMKLYENPLTDKGLKQFDEAAKSLEGAK